LKEEEEEEENDGEEEEGEAIVLATPSVDSSLPDIGDSLFEEHSLADYSRRDSTDDSSRAIIATDSPIASLSVKNIYSSSLSSSSRKRLLLSKLKIYADQEE
jgi:hypothetical protein